MDDFHNVNYFKCEIPLLESSRCWFSLTV